MAEWQRGPDEHSPENALWLGRGEDRFPLRAEREPDEHGALDAEVVHDCDRVGRELPRRVRRRTRRTIGSTIAAAVECDDTMRAREVRDLHLPVPGMDDRPRRQQHDRRVAFTEDLVEQLHAVTFDVAVDFWFACSRHDPFFFRFSASSERSHRSIVCNRFS